MTDAKPATDEQVDTTRRRSHAEETRMCVWSGASVRSLIARIDTERAARLAAEARVKVLTEALMRLVMAHQVRIFVARNPNVDTSALTAARAALKEPANG